MLYSAIYKRKEHWGTCDVYKYAFLSFGGRGDLLVRVGKGLLVLASAEHTA